MAGGDTSTQTEPGKATRNGSVSEVLVSVSSKERASWLKTVVPTRGMLARFCGVSHRYEQVTQRKFFISNSYHLPE